MTNSNPVPRPTDVSESREVRELRALHADVVEKVARGGAQDHAFMSDVVRKVQAYRHSEPTLQAEILLGAAQYFYYRASDTHRGLEAAMEAVITARNASLRHILRKALTFSAILSMNLRNVRGAIDDASEALEIAVELGDRVGQSVVSTNIGGFLLELFYYDDALQLFRFALATGTNSPQAQLITRSCLCNVGLIYLAKHEFRAGIEALRSAIQLLGEPATAGDLWLRVLMEWGYTRLLLATAKVSDARLHAALAKTYAAKADTPRAYFYADCAEAMVEAYEGNSDIATTRLIVALEKSRAISTDQRDMLASIIQIAEHMGDGERADYYKQELQKFAMDTQRETQLDLELLHVRRLKRDKGTDPSALKVIENHYDQRSRERVQRAIAKAT